MASFLLLQPAFGQELDAVVAQAIQSYQKGQYQEAADSFKKAVESDPNNPALLYNWGLSSYKLNQKGLALGAWRKALAVQPSFSRAERAIRFAEKDIPRAAFAEDSFWESYRLFFKNTSSQKLLFVTAILIALTGFLAIRYLSRRKAAISDETPMPPFPIVLTVFGFLLLITLTLTISKLIDSSDIRATVVATPATVRTSPEAQATSIAELPEGGEVVIRRHEAGWAQVSYPGGITGWIELGKILPATGKSTW